MYLKVARLNQTLGRMHLSVRYYDLHLKYNPEDREVRRELVKLHLEMGDAASAVRHLEKLHRDEPENLEIFLLLADALEKMRSGGESAALPGGDAESPPDEEPLEADGASPRRGGAPGVARELPELLTTDKTFLELFLEADSGAGDVQPVVFRSERIAPLPAAKPKPAVPPPAAPPPAALIREWIEEELKKKGEEAPGGSAADVPAAQAQSEEAPAPAEPVVEPVPAPGTLRPPRAARPAPAPVSELPPAPPPPPTPFTDIDLPQRANPWVSTARAPARRVYFRQGGGIAAIVSDAFTWLFAACCYYSLRLCIAVQSLRRTGLSRQTWYVLAGALAILLFYALRPSATVTEDQNRFNSIDMEVRGKIRVPRGVTPVEAGAGMLYIPGLRIRFEMPDVPLSVERAGKDILFSEAGEFALTVKGLTSARTPAWMNVRAFLRNVGIASRNRVFISSQPCRVRIGELVFRPRSPKSREKKRDTGEKQPRRRFRGSKGVF